MKEQIMEALKTNKAFDALDKQTQENILKKVYLFSKRQINLAAMVREIIEEF